MIGIRLVGEITYREGFIRSSNVGMAKLEQAMGEKDLAKLHQKFGLFEVNKCWLR